MTNMKYIKELLNQQKSCDRKYAENCDKDIGCTFDYIKHIKWFFEIEE